MNHFYCAFATGYPLPGSSAPKPPALALSNGTFTVGDEVLDVTPKSLDNVISLIGTQLDLEGCMYEQVDALACDVLEKTNELNASLGNPVPDLGALQCFRVRKNNKSAPFYQYFQSRFPQFPFVYIFTDRADKRIFSNCELLSQKLTLLCGLEQVDLQGKTSKYRKFLSTAECYAASAKELR